MRNWVQREIVDKNLPWEDSQGVQGSKSVFCRHFAVAGLTTKLYNELASVKQEKNESVATFINRIRAITDRLQLDPNEHSIILQVEQKFLPHIRANINQYKISHYDQRRGTEYDFETLNELIQVALMAGEQSESIVQQVRDTLPRRPATSRRYEDRRQHINAHGHHHDRSHHSEVAALHHDFKRHDLVVVAGMMAISMRWQVPLLVNVIGADALVTVVTSASTRVIRMVVASTTDVQHRSTHLVTAQMVDEMVDGMDRHPSHLHVAS
jgi:hypothetical protein